MVDRNPERIKIENALRKIKRDFITKRSEILKSDMSEEEKETRISQLLVETQNIEEILKWKTSLDELPEDLREYLGLEEESSEIVVDENIINTLVKLYSDAAKGKRDDFIPITNDKNDGTEVDTTEFEKELKEYFTEHYSELFSTDYNVFLSENTRKADGSRKENGEIVEIAINGEIVEIAIRCNIDPKKVAYYGGNLVIQDGLVAKEEGILGKLKVYYATEEGINERIFDEYSQMLYREITSSHDDYSVDQKRKLKNNYLRYAEKEGMEIYNKDVLEEIEVSSEKVQALTEYISRVLSNREFALPEDFNEKVSNEITEQYSKIMNQTRYDFCDLEAVKQIGASCIDSLYLRIEEDSIIRSDDFRPDIAWATPEYLKEEYEETMRKVGALHLTNAFVDGQYDVEKVNRKKRVLRYYIEKNNIEGIDTSITPVEIDHEMTNRIANAIVEYYGVSPEKKDVIRTRILDIVEFNWSEIMTECQHIELGDFIPEELMGRRFSIDSLYVKEDFVALGGMGHLRDKVIYATPEALQHNLREIDDKISKKDNTYDEEYKRKSLVQYAQEQGFNIEIPDIEVIKDRKRAEKEYFNSAFDRFSARNLPDDPTARKAISLNDSVFDVVYKISEGNPGAINAVMSLVSEKELGLFLVLDLDDMNMRGSQIWVAYKDWAKEKPEKFIKAVKDRNPQMIEFVNEELAAVDGEKAVAYGASFDRSKKPGKYRFTQEEVNKLKEQRETRREKERENWNKMVANSPSRKNRGPKAREERAAKREAYRQGLINKGKRSIKELDDELTDLEEKEKQAKALYNEFEEQLPTDKSHQDE